MFKKIFSVILVLIICCSISITVFSQADHSHAERNAPAARDEGSAIDDSIAPDPEEEDTDREIRTSSEFVVTTTVSPEYWEELDAPDEVLAAPTPELLEYFLQTKFLRRQLFACLLIDSPDIDFSCHKAFRELLSREDFLDTLEDRAKTILDASKSDDDEDKRMIEKILAQPRVRSLVSDAPNPAYNYPNLQCMYSSIYAESGLYNIMPAFRIEITDLEVYVVSEEDPEYWEERHGAPDEVLSGTTSELLEYFLQTQFMRLELHSEVYASSFSAIPTEDFDYSVHEAFRELLSREDFLDTLEDHAKTILDASKSDDDEDKRMIEKILAQPRVRSLVSDSANAAYDYPNLKSMYAALDADAAPAEVGDYVGTLNGIRYYSAGTISTANNRSVEVCTPHRDWTATEIKEINRLHDKSGNTRLDEPTTVYNCHSYAWYRYSTANPYWINDISEFTRDSACTRIPVSSAQANDIIVYLDAAGDPVHSGVVYSVSSSGALTICSKWSQAGAYRHAVDNVIPEYCSNPITGEVRYVLYRYHDYTNKYIGNNYHSGTSHYFQFANVCDVCGKRMNTTWQTLVCSGPPCNVPYSVPKPEEID